MEPHANTAPPAGAGQPAAASGQGSGQRQPNFVFVLTDDLSWNLIQFMPHVQKMQSDGVNFSNYFVTDSLCCPSRSSIFTGRYPHNTGIFTNTGADGGYLAFLNRGHERTTFATALSAAGYRTAMLGKYLNGYHPFEHQRAPGWTEWDVAGNGYSGFKYNLNRNGTLARYGNKPENYLTDVISGLAVAFIKQSAGLPFIVEVATFAPHAPYTPAPRDASAFAGLTAPRTPAYDAAPGPEMPGWLKVFPPLSEADKASIDRDFRKRAQSVLAVDAMIGDLQNALASIGQLENTYFIFSSDNGYHMGEHRLMPGKMTAYDMDIRVPLIVTGPGVPAGQKVEDIAENIDLAPTFTELSGAASPGNVDGRSLAPFLRGEKPAEWRTIALIEHHGPVRDLADPDMPLRRRGGNPTTYEAMRTREFLYVEYASGEKEYHAFASDPDELNNSYASLPDAQKELLRATLARMAACQGAQNCLAAERAAQSARWE